MKINKVLEDELDRQFPKGDKARGKALVINAIANIEIENAENAIKQKILEMIDNKLYSNREVLSDFSVPDNIKRNFSGMIIELEWIKKEIRK